MKDQEVKEPIPPTKRIHKVNKNIFYNSDFDKLTFLIKRSFFEIVTNPIL